jgi:hypothetical protein
MQLHEPKRTASKSIANYREIHKQLSAFGNLLQDDERAFSLRSLAYKPKTVLEAKKLVAEHSDQFEQAIADAKTRETIIERSSFALTLSAIGTAILFAKKLIPFSLFAAGGAIVAVAVLGNFIEAAGKEIYGTTKKTQELWEKAVRLANGQS